MAKSKNNKKGSWGGAREGAGKPKNPQRQEFLKVYADIKNHANEEVEAKDETTGKTIKKKRVLFLLDTLYSLATKDKNVYAVKEYFDRALGKSRQYVEVDDNDNEELEDIRKDLKELTNGKSNKNTTRPVRNRRKKRK